MKNGILKALLTQKFIYNSGNKTLKKTSGEEKLFSKGKRKGFFEKTYIPDGQLKSFIK